MTEQPSEQPAAPQANPAMFQVVYRTSDRLIVGLSPKGAGVGPNNRLAVIRDLSQYQNLMRYDPAYLAADGVTIVGTKPT